MLASDDGLGHLPGRLPLRSYPVDRQNGRHLVLSTRLPAVPGYPIVPTKIQSYRWPVGASSEACTQKYTILALELSVNCSGGQWDTEILLSNASRFFQTYELTYSHVLGGFCDCDSVI
jgi:hypothetical protein